MQRVAYLVCRLMMITTLCLLVASPALSQTKTVHSKFNITVYIMEYKDGETMRYEIDYRVEGAEMVKDFPLNVKLQDGWAIQILLDEQSPPSALVHTRSCRWVRRR